MYTTVHLRYRYRSKQSEVEDSRQKSCKPPDVSTRLPRSELIHRHLVYRIWSVKLRPSMSNSWPCCAYASTCFNSASRQISRPDWPKSRLDQTSLTTRQLLRNRQMQIRPQIRIKGTDLSSTFNIELSPWVQIIGMIIYQRDSSNSNRHSSSTARLQLI